MQEANADTVLGDFNDSSFTYFDTTSRFFRRSEKLYVRTDGPDGKLVDYPIKYAFGVYPLQQYLIEFPGGRLQALSIAWDARPKEQGGQHWFHLYPNDEIKHDDPLHWTGPNQNWNYMCAECHSTNLQKNYDLEKRRYDTTWADIDVSCEACHGPGSKHAEWAESTPKGETYDKNDNKGLAVVLNEPGHWNIDTDSGLARRSPLRESRVQVETCARCHARRSALWGDYRHGRPLLDTHLPAVLTEQLYHADGQIDDEVYVYGSFLQSKMYREGVTCSDCHEPHSLKLRSEGNQLCATCHLASKFDTPKHHFHQSKTEAAQCTACHMPQKKYMVVDPRADHSFRIPRPDLSTNIGSPNACTQCHAGRTDEWAAKAVDNWYGEKQRGKFEFHYGEAIYAAQTGAADAERMLAVLAQDPRQPGIARATAASLIQSYLSPVTLPALVRALGDPDPLVRAYALQALDAFPPQDKLRLANHLLTDPVRVVRIEAARALADTRERFTKENRRAFENALKEYIKAQRENTDRPESHVNLGNLFARSGGVKEAEDAYKKAIDIDPGFAPAYVNLADLYRSQNRDADGERVLREAIKRLPDIGFLRHAYGLLLVRQKQLPEALDALKNATILEPQNVRYHYVYAVALNSAGQKDEAIRVLETAHALQRSDRDVLYGLITFHQEAGHLQAARDYAKTLTTLSPWDRNAQNLLRQLGSGN